MFLIFCVALLIPVIDGSCYTDSVKIRQTASGRNITVCTLQNGLEILNGSVVKLASCEICRCGEKELSCCGFGAMAGVGPTPPKECKMIRDGCEEIMVRKAEETKECYTGNSILVNNLPIYPFLMPNFQDMT